MENSIVKPLNQTLFSSTFAPPTALRECKLDIKFQNENSPLDAIFDAPRNDLPLSIEVAICEQKFVFSTHLHSLMTYALASGLPGQQT
jgi:hypothetical protein